MTTSGDGRSLRWEEHRRARREHVLAATVALIDRDGVGVSIDEIAAAASIPRSTLYKFFADRADLEEQIRARIVADLIDAAGGGARADDSLRSFITRSVGQYVAWVGAHPHLQRFMTGDGPAGGASPVSDAVAGGRRAFAAMVEEAARAVLGDAAMQPGADRIITHTGRAIIGLAEASVVGHDLVQRTETEAAELTAFVAEAICAVVQASATLVGVEADLDARPAPTPA